MKPQSLPAEVHDHFSKANVLYGYMEKSLVDAQQNALEAGQLLLSAKATVPHGGWEDACGRLFDGSLSSARFCMAFARDLKSLPKRQASGVLLIECTLEGAAKAAKRLANPKPPKPKGDVKEQMPDSELQPRSEGTCNQLPNSDEPIEADSEQVDITDGTWEPILPGHREPETPEEPPKRNGTPPKQYPGSHWFKQYQQAIGPLCRIVDKIAEGFGDSPTGSQKVVQDRLQLATDEMQEWLGVEVEK